MQKDYWVECPNCMASVGMLEAETVRDGNFLVCHVCDHRIRVEGEKNGK